MKKRIDFDGEYAPFAAGKMREMGPVKDEEMENVLNETMRQWLETPAEWLDGRTPDQYFAGKNAGGAGGAADGLYSGGHERAGASVRTHCRNPGLCSGAEGGGGRR